MSTVTLKTFAETVLNTTAPKPTVVQTIGSQATSQTIEQRLEKVSLTPGLGLRALGWRFYQDMASGDSNPLVIQAGERRQVPVFDGGPTSQQFGRSSTNWLNHTSWRFYPDALGDVFCYRLNLTARPSVNNKAFAVDFDIGTANRVWNDRVFLTSGAGVPVPKSFEATIGCSAGIMSNGGAFYITPEADLYITRVSVLAIKQYSVSG